MTLTLRTGTYVGFRLTSKEKIFEWTQIRPVVFYLTYATDVLIVCGVLYFIYVSTNSIESNTLEAESSVFPSENDIRNVTTRSSVKFDGKVDGNLG